MKTKTYNLKPSPRNIKAEQNDKLFLTVRIGNQQVGGTAIFKDGVLLLKGDLSDKTYIGNANDLYNQSLEIATAVLDMNKSTNMCVISTAITNQKNQLLFSYNDSGEAPENGIATFIGLYKIVPLILLIFNLFFISTSSAQESKNSAEESIVEFDKLKTPSSPGFALLDATPESIARPTTPEGLAVNFITLAQGNGGAIEFAPFWLYQHPKMSIESMYNTKIPFFSTMSVSAATVKKGEITYLTGGLRTRIFQSFGKTNRETMDKVATKLKDELGSYAEAVLKGNEKAQDSIIELIAVERQKFVEAYEDPGFTIDLAAAVGGSSEVSSYDDIKYDRWATWLSFNFKINKKLNGTILARYITNEEIESATAKMDVGDAGARFNYDINEKFSISAEYVQRFVFNTDDTYNRIAAIGSWKISDNFYATGTFGKNFEDIDNIIAVAGINFGFSEKKQKLK